MSSQQVQPTAYCMNCGAQIQAGSAFCSHCGQAQTAQPPQPAQPAQSGCLAFMKKYGFWLFLLSVVYIILPIDLLPDFIPCGGWADDAFAGIGGTASLALKLAAAGLRGDELALVIMVVTVAVIAGIIILACILTDAFAAASALGLALSMI